LVGKLSNIQKLQGRLTLIKHKPISSEIECKKGQKPEAQSFPLLECQLINMENLSRIWIYVHIVYSWQTLAWIRGRHHKFLEFIESKAFYR